MQILNILTGTTARVIFALPLGIFGLFHFMSGDKMAGMVPSWVPGGVFWVYLMGVALLAACVGIITNFKDLGKLAAFLVGVLLLIFVLTIHLPGVINAQNEMASMMAMSALLKDTSMAGGAWVVSGLLMKD